MFTRDTACLEAQLASGVLETLLVGATFGEVRELEEDRLSLAGTHVGGTRGDNTVDRVLGELHSRLLLCSEKIRERLVDRAEIRAVDD